LYEVVNANNDIDAGDLGGSDGAPLVITENNVVKLLGVTNRKLDEQNVDMERKNRCLAISPQVFDKLWLAIQGRESLLGDKTGEFGNLGRYAGIELFMTNNLTASALWTPVNNPTDTQTITIGGVTMKFVATLSGTATAQPEFHIGTTLADTLTNMAVALNAPNTAIVEAATTGYQKPTTASLRKMQAMAATATSAAITIFVKGGSYPTVATSDAADVWSNTTQHLLATVKKAIDIVVQKEPDVEMDSTVSNGKRGMNIMPLTVFGVKTFNQGKNEIVNIKADSSNYS
jgi:hypothetical protein